MIYIQARGPRSWVINANNRCLNRDGEWEYEPQPYNRDSDFIERTRFPDPGTANDVLARYWKVIVKRDPELFDESKSFLRDRENRE